MIPPTKVPKNWKVEKKPIDEPLDDGGATFDTDDGKDASRTLNAAIKKIRDRIVCTAL